MIIDTNSKIYFCIFCYWWNINNLYIQPIALKKRIILIKLINILSINSTINKIYSPNNIDNKRSIVVVNVPKESILLVLKKTTID